MQTVSISQALHFRNFGDGGFAQRTLLILLHEIVYAVATKEMPTAEANGLVVQDVLQADSTRNLTEYLLLLINGSIISSGFFSKLCG